MPTLDQLRNLGQEIRRLRNGAGLTGDELGKAIGKGQSYISALENMTPSRSGDPITPSDEALADLAKYFGVPVSRFHQLLGRANDMVVVSKEARRVVLGFQHAPEHIRRAIDEMVERYLPDSPEVLTSTSQRSRVQTTAKAKKSDEMQIIGTIKFEALGSVSSPKKLRRQVGFKKRTSSLRIQR